MTLISREQPTYSCWHGMKYRCFNPKSKEYKNYGARGISVCDRWLHSFENFFLDMGRKPAGRSIDRIDNNGNYEPSNCRWATIQEQNSNKRDCIHLEYAGLIMTIEEWGRLIGRHPTTLRTRLRAGYPLDLVMRSEKLLFGKVPAPAAMEGQEP